MTTFRFRSSGITELSTILTLHQSFISAENPESVYVLYGKRREDAVDVYRSVMVHNSHPEPVNGFQVRREDLDDASVHLLTAEPWLEVVGVVHTHEGPEAPRPSQVDIVDAVPGHLHAIVCPQHNAVVFYDGLGTHSVYTQVRGGKFVSADGADLRKSLIHTEDTHPHERHDT